MFNSRLLPTLDSDGIAAAISIALIAVAVIIVLGYSLAASHAAGEEEHLQKLIQEEVTRQTR